MYRKISSSSPRLVLLIRSQQAQVQMGWFPQVNDNDLIVVCTVDNAMNVTATHERYQAKQTNPVSMRGLDRKGRKERDEDFGNRHVIDQNFRDDACSEQ
jgi:hypothetical protein